MTWTPFLTEIRLVEQLRASLRAARVIAPRGLHLTGSGAAIRSEIALPWDGDYDEELPRLFKRVRSGLGGIDRMDDLPAAWLYHDRTIDRGAAALLEGRHDRLRGSGAGGGGGSGGDPAGQALIGLGVKCREDDAGEDGAGGECSGGEIMRHRVMDLLGRIAGEMPMRMAWDGLDSSYTPGGAAPEARWMQTSIVIDHDGAAGFSGVGNGPGNGNNNGGGVPPTDPFDIEP